MTTVFEEYIKNNIPIFYPYKNQPNKYRFCYQGCSKCRVGAKCLLMKRTPFIYKKTMLKYKMENPELFI